MLTPTLLAVLRALFDLGRRDRAASPEALAARTRLASRHVARALRHLEARGLVDATRCRLTLAGLAFAASARPAGRLALDASPRARAA
jgi:Mn-dependent DtxR family transcriptional regulator